MMYMLKNIMQLSLCMMKDVEPVRAAVHAGEPKCAVRMCAWCARRTELVVRKKVAHQS